VTAILDRPDAYDIFLVLAGLALLVITLGTRLLERLHINSTYIYVLVGILAGPVVLGMAPDEPLAANYTLKRVAELAVTIGLVVLGIRIGRPVSWNGWQSTVRLVLVVMPATILGVAAAGVWILGLAVGPAVLLGAILAPTDPILAGPLEEHSTETDPEDRFGLSSEAGLNDGLAFPFIYLGLYLTVRPAEWSSWIGRWLVLDLVYAVGMALPLGWWIGRLCGRLYVRLMARDAVSRSRRLFVPLALLLAVYGLVEILGGYGFLAAFAAGHGFRIPFESEPDRLTSFADFTESVDELAKAAVLVLMGALVPWSEIWAGRWPLLVFALVLIVVLRPVMTWLATAGGRFSGEERIYWSWFGIRGIGSIYYMAYALEQDLADATARPIMATTLAVVLVSILLHGLSVGPVLKRLKGEEHVEG
jgi:sodium/hydrogen antiporter